MTATRANARVFFCDLTELSEATVVTAPAVPVFGFAPLSRAAASEAAGEDGWPCSLFSPDGKEATLTSAILLATDARLSMYSWDDDDDDDGDDDELCGRCHKTRRTWHAMASKDQEKTGVGVGVGVLNPASYRIDYIKQKRPAVHLCL